MHSPHAVILYWSEVFVSAVMRFYFSSLASRVLVNSFHESYSTYSTYSSSADVLHLARALEKVGGARQCY